MFILFWAADQVAFLQEVGGDVLDVELIPQRIPHTKSQS